MRRWIGLMGLWLLCLIGPPAVQAYDATDVAGVRAYRQQLARTLTRKVGTLRHTTPGGTVRLRFVVGRDGVVTQSEVEASSGAEATDRLALAIVPVGLRLPPLPAEAPIRSLAVTVPLHFPPRGAATPDSVRAYRDEVTQTLFSRFRNLPHRMLTGGTVHIRFTIGRDGIVTRSEIARSSGYRNIDEVGLRIVPVGLRLPPLPPSAPGALSLTQPFAFDLAPEGI